MNTSFFSALIHLKSRDQSKWGLGLIAPIMILPQVMEWMVQHGNDSQLPWLISKIALAALIYHVWGERN